MWSEPESYEGYIGRWSRVVAPEFLAWLHARRNLRWLDDGCGTGELTRAIFEHNAPESVDGFDISEMYVDYARRRTNDPRATFAVANAQALPCDDAVYDVAVAGLCLNAMPDQPLAVAEMMRVVKPGGIVGAYVWDFDGKMQMLTHFWDTVEALDPGAQDTSLDPLFAICKPERLAELFRAAGSHDVEVRAIDAPTVFKSFDDFWNPFLNGKAPAQRHTASLSPERREVLRERLQSTLPISSHGSILLIARAWAVKARVPH